MRHNNDTETHDHDHGLTFDISTLMRRRQALRLFAGSGLVALVGCGSSKLATSAAATSSTTGNTASASSSTSTTPTTAASAVTTEVGSETTLAIPEETAGPYPGDGSNGVNVLGQSGIVRSDIRSSFGSSSTVAAGIPTTVRLKIVSAGNGQPLAGAAVYLWHADINGNYSLYSSAITNENYLRGVQETDATGMVSFTSIHPGCYSGRWPHMHFEVYPSLAAATVSSSKIATSQLALPEPVCTAVYATSGYSASVTNFSHISLKTDNVFSDGADRETPSATGDIAGGYTLALTVPVAA